MPARWLRSAVLVLASMTLFACSPQADVPAPTATSTTAATTTQPPTPEELAAEAAMAAFNGMHQVTEAAARDPGAKDWEPEIRQFAGDPFAFLEVQSIRDFATRGIRQAGEVTVEAEVTAVDLASLEGPTVMITACFDRTESDLVYADTGESIRPPGAPAELPRVVSNVKVIHYEAEPGQPWLVSTVDTQPDQPC